MANQNINKMTVVLEGNSEKLEAALKAAERAMDKFDKKSERVGSSKGGGLNGILATAKRLAPAISAAFAVREIAVFSKESYILAARLEGIERNFKDIESTGKTSLQELRNATMGAVSDFDLMQKAVQARNFKLPLENLASFFEFATIRSQQTGESVDYLVNSIVLGIGRKSPLILDNLGITLVRLKEAMGKVGRESATVAEISQAVSKIAQEETEFMKNLGDAAQTSGQRIDGLSASWKNFRTEFGKSIVDGGDSGTSTLSEAIDDARTFLEYANTKGGGSMIGNALSSVNVLFNSLVGVGEGQLEEMRQELEDLAKQAEVLEKTALDDLFKRFGTQVGDSVTEVIKFSTELHKLSENGEITKEELERYKVGLKQYRQILEDQNKSINDQLVAEKQLADGREEFLSKYKNQLKEIEVRFNLGMIDPVKKAELENKVLSDAIVKMTADVSELGLTALEEYSEWNLLLDKNKELISNSSLEIATQKQLIEELTDEGKRFMSEFDPRKIESDSFDLIDIDSEQLSELDKLEIDRLKRFKELNQLQKDGLITEREANSERLAALNQYLEALSIAGEEIPSWMTQLREDLKGTIFDKDELQDMASMWAQLSSALGQLSNSFNGDSGITGFMSKFVKLAQAITAAAAAKAALDVLFGKLDSPVAAIAAATAVAGSLGTMITSLSGMGGGGSGMSYGGGLNTSQKLYTEIRGRDLRIMLDRESKFSDRRG